MEKQLVSKFRIVQAVQTESDGLFKISLADRAGHNYGPDFRDWDEFNTHQEALDHALNSDNWFQKVFTILPLYYIQEKSEY